MPIKKPAAFDATKLPLGQRNFLTPLIDGPDVVLKLDWLKPVSEPDGAFRLRGATLDPSSSPDLLVLRATAAIYGEVLKIKAMFGFHAGRLYDGLLIGQITDVRRVLRLIEMQASADLGGHRYLWVLNSENRLVTDVEFNLVNEPFRAGVCAYFTDFSARLDSNTQIVWGLKRVPGVSESSLRDGYPHSMRLVPAGEAGFDVLVTWKGTGDKIGNLPIESITVAFTPSRPKKLAQAAFVTYTALIGAKKVPLQFTTTLADPNPSIELVLEQPLLLEDGLSAVAALMGSKSDLAEVLPFKHLDIQPALSYARFQQHQAEATVTLRHRNGDPVQWEPAHGFAISDLAAAFTIVDGHPRLEAIYGEFTLFGAQFEAEVVPKDFIRAELAEPAQINAGDFLRLAFGPAFASSSLNVTIAEAEYTVDLDEDHDADNRFEIAIDGHIDLLGNGTFVLTEVRLAANYYCGHIDERYITGTIDVAGVPMRVQGVYDYDHEGWMFEGGLAPGKKIPVGELLDQLLHHVDAPTPPGLASLELENLTLRYAAKPRDYYFLASTSYPVPADAPFCANSSQNVLAEVRSFKVAKTGKRETEVNLGWRLYDDDMQFNVYASHTSAGNDFRLMWDDPKGKAISLERLMGALHMQDLPGEAAWDLFHFDRLAIDYTGTPRKITLASQSRYGGGTLSCVAQLAKGERMFQMAWEAPNAQTHFELSRLLEPMNAGSSFPTFGTLPSSIFEIDDVAMVYRPDPKPSLVVYGESHYGLFSKVFFAGSKETGSWGAMAGVAFRPDVHIKDIPGLGKVAPLASLLEAVDISPLLIIASTFTSKRFTPSALLGDAVQGLNGAPLPLSKGATLAAKIDLGKSSSGAISTLANKILKRGELIAEVTVSNSQVQIAALIDGDLSVKLGSAKLNFHDSYVMLNAGQGALEVVFGGTVAASVFGSGSMQFGCRMSVDEAEIAGSSGPLPVALPGPPALPGVHFKEGTYLELGMTTEPEGMLFGLMSDFYIGDDPGNKTYTGSAVVVLDMVEEIPDPKYVYLTIGQLDLWAWMEAQFGMGRWLNAAGEAAKLAGKRPALLNEVTAAYRNLQGVLGEVHFDHVILHYCQDNQVMLPDGTLAQAGAGFQGHLELFGWNAFAAMECSNTGTPSFDGIITVEPINLFDVLKITGDGTGVDVAADWQPGQQIDWSSQQARRGAMKPHAGPRTTLVKAGGPVLALSTSGERILHASAGVSLLGIPCASVLLDVTRSGFEFDLELGAGDVAHFSLKCHLGDGPEGKEFTASGDTSIHLDAEIGPIIPGVDATAFHLSAGLDAHLDFHVTGKAFALTVRGGFEFEGLHLTMPDLTINEAFSDLAQLPGKVVDWIKQKASEIFDCIFGELKKAAEWVADKAKLVAEETKEIAVGIYNAASDALSSATGVLFDAAKMAKLAKEQVEQFTHKAADVAVQAGQKVVEIANAARQEVERLASQAADALVNAGRTVTQAAITATISMLRDAGKIANTISDGVDYVKKKGRELIDYGKRLLTETTSAIADIEDKAAKIVNQLEEDTKIVLNKVAEAASWLANKLKEGAEAVGHGIVSAAEDVGHAFSDLGHALFG